MEKRMEATIVYWGIYRVTCTLNRVAVEEFKLNSQNMDRNWMVSFPSAGILISFSSAATPVNHRKAGRR